MNGLFCYEIGTLRCMQLGSWARQIGDPGRLYSCAGVACRHYHVNWGIRHLCCQHVLACTRMLSARLMRGRH